MSKRIFSFALLLATLAATAQDTTGKRLNEVVVTANKYPQKQRETGKVITVINQTTLQHLSTKTIGEVLNTVAGVTINGANNNPGTNLGVSIRGSSFGNALILIDGIPVNDPSLTSNYYDLNFINLNQVERIEILKGGQSTLYGSDAVAGVINIITKKAGDKPLSVQAIAKAGSYGTFDGTAGINGHLKKWTYSLQHTFVHSDGFSSAYDSTGHANFDRDGFRQNTTRATLGYALSNKVTTQVFGSYSGYKAGIDAGAFQDDADYTIKNKNAQGGMGLTVAQAHGRLQFNYHFNYVQRSYLNDSADRSNPYAYYSNSSYTGRTHFAELYQTFQLAPVQLLIGADYRYNNTAQESSSIGSFGPYTAAPFTGHMWQLSPYASAVYDRQGWNVELGGRWNYHNTYGNNFTYTFNPSYLIRDKVKLFGNLSSAFKVPSLYQLFDAAAGNKDLQPETSTTVEGGLAVYAADGLQLRTTYFNRQTKNAILYVITDPANYTAQYRNSNRQNARGVEVEAAYQTSKWNIVSNYTYTAARIKSDFTESGNALGKDTTYNNLYRVPRHAVNAFVSYNITPQLNIGTLVKYVGKRMEPVYMATPNTLAAYYTIDLSASYRFNPAWRIFADFKNITNQRYFDISGYTSRRFNLMAGVQVTF